MLRKIPPVDVKLGMYVAGFGGSWLQHPFWRPRFVVRSPRDLERLTSSAVPYVLIDEALGLPAAVPPAAIADPIRTPPSPSPSLRPPLHSRPLRELDPVARQLFAQRRASALVSRTKVRVRRIFEDMQLGWALDRATADGVVDDIFEAIDEDARALMSVLRLKTKDDYTYLHSVAVCTLMICVARQRGLDKGQTRDLGLAGLLHDVGKVGIPDPILNKPCGLTDPEFAIVRNHPEHGYRLLSGSAEMPDSALDVCRHHHEKIDGTGYPFGLTGEQISFAARLGAVCDVFDALTSQRAYKAAWAPQKALTRMWSWEGHFDRTLIADLMLALHIFAEGLLVRLSDATLALTLPQDPASGQAEVIAFHSVERQASIPPKHLRITQGERKLRILAVEDPADWGFADWPEMAARLAGVVAKG